MAHPTESAPRHAQAMPHEHQGKSPYLRLAAMAILSYGAMYALMYAMVDRPGNVYANLNNAYMAGLMASPMVAIELALMGRMYPSKGANAALFALSVAATGLLWWAIRAQAAVDDEAFLRSMIPHHAGAILMCNEASITRPELRDLCAGIVRSQEEEIGQMKAMLPP